MRGRISGKPIRLSISPSEFKGKKYLVSLAGDREWVKNVRAAQGEAFIIHGGRRRVCLHEIPVNERAPILLAYVQRRAFTRSSPKRAARLYFVTGNKMYRESFCKPERGVQTLGIARLSEAMMLQGFTDWAEHLGSEQ